jgi:tripartite-type tricarboxylate transporter receptor subunit TctC
MKKLLLVLSLALITGLAQAKTYKVFVGTPAGSGADVQTRKLFTEVSKETGDTFVVVNKPGANFVISYNAFLEDAKGGNSAIMFSPTALQLALHDRNETFEGKGLVVLHKINYFVATRSDSPIKAAADIKNLNIGSAFAVSELLVKQYLSDNNVIPYKSDNEATMALLKGEVPAVSTNSMNNALVANADKIKVINAFPQNVVGMSAYAVNKEFPEAERAKLNEVINKVIKGEEFKTWLKSVFSLNVEGGSTARYDELNNRLLGELFKVKK